MNRESIKLIIAINKAIFFLLLADGEENGKLSRSAEIINTPSKGKISKDNNNIYEYM
jgi:hypothetical protein